MMSNEQMHRTAPPRRGVDGGPIRRVITISLFLLLVVAAAVLAVEVEETTSSIKMSKSVLAEGSSNTSPSTYRKTAAQHQDQHVHTSWRPQRHGMLACSPGQGHTVFFRPLWSVALGLCCHTNRSAVSLNFLLAALSSARRSCRFGGLCLRASDNAGPSAMVCGVLDCTCELLTGSRGVTAAQAVEGRPLSPGLTSTDRLWPFSANGVQAEAPLPRACTTDYC